MLIYELYKEVGSVSTGLVAAPGSTAGTQHFVRRSGRETRRWQKPADGAGECRWEAAVAVADVAVAAAVYADCL